MADFQSLQSSEGFPRSPKGAVLRRRGALGGAGSGEGPAAVSAAAASLQRVGGETETDAFDGHLRCRCCCCCRSVSATTMSAARAAGRQPPLLGFDVCTGRRRRRRRRRCRCRCHCRRPPWRQPPLLLLLSAAAPARRHRGNPPKRVRPARARGPSAGRLSAVLGQPRKRARRRHVPAAPRAAVAAACRRHSPPEQRRLAAGARLVPAARRVCGRGLDHVECPVRVHHEDGARLGRAVQRRVAQHAALREERSRGATRQTNRHCQPVKPGGEANERGGRRRGASVRVTQGTAKAKKRGGVSARTWADRSSGLKHQSMLA